MIINTPSIQEIRDLLKQNMEAGHFTSAAMKIDGALGNMTAHSWFNKASKVEQAHIRDILERCYADPALKHVSSEGIIRAVKDAIDRHPAGHNVVNAFRPDIIKKFTAENFLAPLKASMPEADKVPGNFVSQVSKLSGEAKVSIGLSAIVAGLSLADGAHRLMTRSTSVDEEGRSKLNYSQITMAGIQLLLGAGFAYLTHSQIKNASVQSIS